LDAVDGDAGLADIADDARMIAVISPMGGEVECDGEPHLPRLEVLAVELVRFLGGGESRILPDGPGAVCIHGGARTPEIGREARQGPERLELLEVEGGVKRLHRDAFRRLPGKRIEPCAAELLLGERPPFRQGLLRKLRHRAAPSASDYTAARAGASNRAGRRSACRATTAAVTSRTAPA